MPVKGFSLVEVLVAMALVVTSAIGLAELFSLASRVTQESRIDTGATFAAEAKMAQLRALTWAYDTAGTGTPLSDAGLSVSPAAALTANVDGFADYVDAAGASVPNGAEAAGRRVYLRRWSLQPLPSDPANALVLQVVATRATRPQSRDAHLISILARTAQ